MKRQWALFGVLALGLLLLALAVGPGRAQGPTGAEAQPQGEVGMAAPVAGFIPIQGRLTDSSGNPLNGNYTITFGLYDVASGGMAKCSSTQTVSVSNGLFSTYIANCTSAVLNGQQLFLGIKVGSDPEMTPRQPIYPVPYAWSLKPGALISDTMGGTPLNVYNHGTGWGLDVYSAGHDAVHGRTGSTNHAGVAGVSWGSGIGVYGESATGVAIKAAGSGIIQSTAATQVFVPGTEAVLLGYPVPSAHLEYYGGGVLEVDPDANNVDAGIGIPVQIPAVLYGQPVRIESLRVYYRTNNSNSYITNTYLTRRASGSGVSLIQNADDRKSTSFTYYDLACTAPECTLDSVGSFVTVGLEFHFADNTHFITVEGVRLTLRHN